MAWVVPTIVYVFLVGLFGIAAKYGLRQVTWQGLVGMTTVAYVIVFAIVAAFGLPFRAADATSSARDWSMAVVASLIAPLTIVLFFLAVSRGPVTKIVPLTSVYPLVTVLVGALVLSESVSWQTGAGALLIVGGVALLGI
jgi:bacterial/archaeal transporter family protein